MLPLHLLLLHLLLDSVAGGIYWLSPFAHHELLLFRIPANFPWWPLNFLLHWSFLLELSLVTAAIVVFRRRRIERQRALQMQKPQP